MCGIFAYKGSKKNATELVIQGLKKLEYRGYDSWGVAYKTDSKINVYKEVGKIGSFDLQNAEGKIDFSLPCSLAVGHSRWATHGGVTVENAHPHLSSDNSIAIVHNGIIENYAELKKDLINKGYKFKSETDTEVIVHLIHDNIKLGLTDAVKKAIGYLHGRYAVLVISKDENILIAARRGSPLIVGSGEKEFFIASDIPAFLEYTRKVMYLDDNQMVVINDRPEFFDLETGKQIEKRIVEINWDAKEAEKGEFPHFMIKEIMEQKETISRAINQDEDKILKIAEAIKKAYGTYLIGCGTAGKVCLAGSYLFAKIAKRHVNSAFGSEFPSLQDFITDKSLMIAVSQSGETADTLEAIEVAKKKNAKVLSIINVEGSSMDRMSDYSINIKAGPEKAVASTKATTSQLAILTLLAYAVAGKLDEGKILLVEAASKINDMLNPRYEERIKTLAEKIMNHESMYVIGKGLNYPMALESAIKLQEVSYIHAEGFAGGELKHGPIALISKDTPCIAIVANDETKHEILGNAMEVKARGGYIIGVSPENNEIFDFWIKVPDAGNASPIVNIIPVQLLAYQLAVLRKNNPDMPRNLAKSVTVK
ncbi:glutamine--fructose-6-phosphate transaminase (isomerizing) [Candidatus Peregrinibacteria bacterium]|nr:glutamine--fructose-6-phosphate transaminase (isomerizing) [Candidatus Peregrinibacteria bacterium]